MASQTENGLKSRFLAGLSEQERARIFALAGELARPLHEWVTRHPQLMRPVRVPQSCLTLAAAAPFLDADALLPAARMIFWIFAVDDLVDEGLLPAAELWSRLERGQLLLEDPDATTSGDDPLLEALQDVRDELARYPLFSPLRPHLVHAYRELLRCMSREHEWSAAYRHSPFRPRPSFSEYLESERHTVGSLPIVLCVLATLGDASILSHLPRLLEMEREVSVSIRLANDLRGYEREVGEGKLNALGILQLELISHDGLGPDAALERAREILTAEIPTGLKRCQELARSDRTESELPERFITDLAAFACDFYANHDYHHTLTINDG